MKIHHAFVNVETRPLVFTTIEMFTFLRKTNRFIPSFFNLQWQAVFKSTYSCYTERKKTKKEVGKVLVLKILNVTSAALCFIYNRKNRDKHRCALANAGKKLFTRFLKAQSIHRGFSYWEMKIIIKKCSFRHWEPIPNFFITPLPISLWCNTKGASGAVCAVGS
jgi:hypothetical protein